MNGFYVFIHIIGVFAGVNLLLTITNPLLFTAAVLMLLLNIAGIVIGVNKQVRRGEIDNSIPVGKQVDLVLIEDKLASRYKRWTWYLYPPGKKFEEQWPTLGTIDWGWTTTEKRAVKAAMQTVEIWAAAQGKTKEIKHAKVTW